jgi:hypothetical protein
MAELPDSLGLARVRRVAGGALDGSRLTSRRYSAVDKRRELMTKVPIAVLGIDL